MSVALFVVTKEEIAGFDPVVDGKAIGRLDDEVLERLCAAAGVASLMEFVSQDPEELAGFLEDEGIDPAEADIAAEAWYTPAEGLAVVRGLIGYLEANPDAVGGATDVLADLREYEAVFTRLAAENVAWHFEVDF